MTAAVDTDTAAPVGALRAAREERPARLRRRSWRQRARLPLMLLGPLLVAVVAGYWYLTGGRYVSTDDAYVDAARVAISTEVSGRVAAIEVRDNERVKAGQVLDFLRVRSSREPPAGLGLGRNIPPERAHINAGKVELADFLLERHAAHQVGDAVFDRTLGVEVNGHLAGGLARQKGKGSQRGGDQQDSLGSVTDHRNHLGCG